MENIDVFEVLVGLSILYMTWLFACMMDLSSEEKKDAGI
jgi:hypothetical protein